MFFSPVLLASPFGGKELPNNSSLLSLSSVPLLRSKFWYMAFIQIFQIFWRCCLLVDYNVLREVSDILVQVFTLSFHNDHRAFVHLLSLTFQFRQNSYTFKMIGPYANILQPRHLCLTSLRHFRDISASCFAYCCASFRQPCCMRQVSRHECLFGFNVFEIWPLRNSACLYTNLNHQMQDCRANSLRSSDVW